MRSSDDRFGPEALPVAAPGDDALNSASRQAAGQFGISLGRPALRVPTRAGIECNIAAAQIGLRSELSRHFLRRRRKRQPEANLGIGDPKWVQQLQVARNAMFRVTGHELSL